MFSFILNLFYIFDATSKPFLESHVTTLSCAFFASDVLNLPIREICQI
jgi:hypothetical protein